MNCIYRSHSTYIWYKFLRDKNCFSIIPFEIFGIFQNKLKKGGNLRFYTTGMTFEISIAIIGNFPSLFFQLLKPFQLLLLLLLIYLLFTIIIIIIYRSQ